MNSTCQTGICLNYFLEENRKYVSSLEEFQQYAKNSYGGK